MGGEPRDRRAPPQHETPRRAGPKHQVRASVDATRPAKARTGSKSSLLI